MADRTSKISELPVANGLTSDDLLVVVDSPGSAGATKRITVGNAVGNLQSNVSITGTLTSTQTAYLQSVSVGGTLVINATGSWVGNTTGLKVKKENRALMELTVLLYRLRMKDPTLFLTHKVKFTTLTVHLMVL